MDLNVGFARESYDRKNRCFFFLSERKYQKTVTAKSLVHLDLSLLINRVLKGEKRMKILIWAFRNTFEAETRT